MYDITAGDPSRGTIALGTHRAPKQGATVQVWTNLLLSSASSDSDQFFHRVIDAEHDPLTEQGVLFAPYSSAGEPLFMPRSLNFTVSRDDASMTRMDRLEGSGEGAYILHDTFIAGSENGFLCSSSPETSWTCTIPGAFATLECVY